jgi:hypothetical protein
MMHGRGKSDSAIVAAKLANNAERSAAEPVEPRTETEGNADQQSTRRAQSRVSVSEALERIRQVAKERKKERFTALFHHISIDLLDEAFFELKQDAAAGVDDLTWRDYRANLDFSGCAFHAVTMSPITSPARAAGPSGSMLTIRIPCSRSGGCAPFRWCARRTC